MPITNQSKEVKIEMYKRIVNNSFICLDEITEKPELLNYVIYNPIHDSIPERAELLYKTILNGIGVSLSSEEINHLVLYEPNQFSLFIDELKAYINNHLSNDK